VDNDCDGAVDEGCDCGTVGESRSCGWSPNLSLPCKPGQQTCQSNGTWSDCVGVVFPAEETCGDGIDNDCNGLVDDGCGEPDGGEDAGVDTGTVEDDGGLTQEICGNGLDDDRNGFIDDGCEVVAYCPPDSVRWDRIQSPDGLTLGSWEAARSAWTGKEHLFAYVGKEEPYGQGQNYKLYLARWGSDGSHLSTTMIADKNVKNPFSRTDDLVWTGDLAVILASGMLFRANADGLSVGVPVATNLGRAIGWNGKRIGMLSIRSGTQAFFEELNTQFEPVASVELDGLGWSDVAWTGTHWIVMGTSSKKVVFLDGTTVVATHALPTEQYTWPFMAVSNHGALVCGHTFRSDFSDPYSARCQLFSGNGELRGDPIAWDGGPFRHGDSGAFWWKSRYMVIFIGDDVGKNTVRIVTIGDDGSVQDVPTPPLGADTGHTPGSWTWYFHSAFDNIEYTPDEIFFETRWLSPYMKSGRMRVYCDTTQ